MIVTLKASGAGISHFHTAEPVVVGSRDSVGICVSRSGEISKYSFYCSGKWILRLIKHSLRLVKANLRDGKNTDETKGMRRDRKHLALCDIRTQDTLNFTLLLSLSF